MLAMSVAVLALFGFGLPSILASDDGDILSDDDIDFDVEADNEIETISLNLFLEPATIEADSNAVSKGDLDSIPESKTSNDRGSSSVEQAALPGTSEEEAPPSVLNEQSSQPNVITGGPGDILAGGAGIDRFEVTVGREGDPETVIENLFEVDETIVAEDAEESEKRETIWLRDPNGHLLSREDLLSSDLDVTYNEEREGLSIALNGHTTLFLEGTYEDDFTDNSLVLGNFGLI